MFEKIEISTVLGALAISVAILVMVSAGFLAVGMPHVSWYMDRWIAVILFIIVLYVILDFIAKKSNHR